MGFKHTLVCGCVLFLLCVAMVGHLGGEDISENLGRAESGGDTPGNAGNNTGIKLNGGPVIYTIGRLEGEIRVDGRVEEAAWEKAFSVDLDTEIAPGENVKAPIQTRCLLLYGENRLYVAFRAEDPNPSAIRAHISDRDKAWDDDAVAVVLDTFNDNNRAFVFFCNPLGVQMDEIMSDGGRKEDESWDAIWNSAGRITEQGYEVEMEIPFRALQFQRGGAAQTWGFIPLRIYPRKFRSQFTSFSHNRADSCLLCQAPRLTGIEHATPGRNIELDPTVTVVHTDNRESFPAGALKNKVSRPEAGVSAHWGLTSNLTFSAAVNPDFSQVEADAAQLEINTKFTLYYPEKRPFFLEGADFFSTPINAVYTRTLADPAWGVKLSGKEGKNTFGLFMSRDELTNLLFPGADGSGNDALERGAMVSVLRYRRDIGSASTLGLLITDREGEDYFNRLAGVDGILRISSSDILRFQFLGSSTRYPDAIASKHSQPDSIFMGYGAEASWRHEVRSFGWSLSLQEFSPEFRADVGFVPQVGYRRASASAHYLLWGDNGSFFSSLMTGFNGMIQGDSGGSLLERYGELFLVAKMPMQSSLNFNAGMRREVYQSVPFDQFYVKGQFKIRPVGGLFVSLYASIRDEVDYDHVRSGRYFYIEPLLQFRVGKKMELSMSGVYSRLRVEQGELFHATLLQGGLVYYFNKHFFFRGVLQYTDIRRNTALYAFPVDARYKYLFSQFLFSLKVNPRTVLFLGYTDNALGLPGFSVTQKNRTLFLKIGYALSM